MLREMFQLDRGDLDFGLYRIMRLKAEEIERFLEDDLLPQVKSALKGITADQRVELEQHLQEKIRQAKSLGVDPDSAPVVKELRRQVADAVADAADEVEVYNHLYHFFERYYDEGDFLSLRRYSGAGVSEYLIPYSGEEVALHWANADQYYIKTSENFASYLFLCEGRRVRFEIAAADQERDNIKASGDNRRFFVLAKGEGNEAVTVDGDDLVILFEHRPLTTSERGSHVNQAAINVETAATIMRRVEAKWQARLGTPAPTEKSPERTVLERHLGRYTAKNRFDYFIHKNLGEFLRRELDFYLKNAMLDLDDVVDGDVARVRRTVARMVATRRVAKKIIAFLAQLEDFQRHLWLKQKFVLETNYCVTLDRVPNSLYPEIVANAAQRKEWVNLFAIDELHEDMSGALGYSAPLTTQFLREHPYLVLDTRHFDARFRDALLAALSEVAPLDEQLDGLLVHGENFQALNLLTARYRGEVQCIYIDPPYNTDASAIMYKNDYKHSSWLSLMDDRLRLSRNLLVDDGSICVAIDDEEMIGLKRLLDGLYHKSLGIVAVRSNPAGRKTKGRLAPAHEYALFYAKTDNSVPGSLKKTENHLKSYPQIDEKGRFAWTNFIRTGSNDLRTDRPKLFYPLFVHEDNTMRVPKMKWSANDQEYQLEEEPRDGELVVLPIRENDNGIIEKNWHRGHERVASELDEYRIRRKDGTIVINFKARMDENARPVTWWGDNKYASALHGAIQIKKLFGVKNFDFLKAMKLVEDCITVASANSDTGFILDYFAGSGTTGHAVINLNREDGGRRKYILVEVGRHFDTVLLPRMKKVTYSKDWKDGKPLSREGVTQLFKYIRLESYEDTLDSLEVTPMASDLLTDNPALAEDYRLRYALKEETSGSACLSGKDFIDPAAYTLSVVRDGVRREMPADLPATFGYLLGLRVETERRIDGILAITGVDAQGRRCLILWRNLNETDNAALERWFTRHRARFTPSPTIIYVNGDHTLNALSEGEGWKAETIEPVFRALMFDGVA